MRALPTLLLLLAPVAVAQTPAATPGGTTPAASASPTQMRAPSLTRAQIEDIRTELRAGKSDLIAKNVSFTSQEAARFWPLYKEYEAAGKTLNDKRFDLLMKYIEAGDKPDPALVRNLVKASLQRDLDLAKLRVDYAPRFAKVLPMEKAARFLQVERALSLVADAKLASMMPLLPWYPWPPLEE